MKRLSSLIFSALFSLLFAAGASLCAAESPAFSVENRSLHLMNGSAFVSPVATTGVKGTKLLADGAAASGWSAESPIWDTATVEDGYHTLALSEDDSASAEVLVINDAGVVIWRRTRYGRRASSTSSGTASGFPQGAAWSSPTARW